MTFRIGEVAQRAQIAASAIHYYEREGLIPKADRRGNTRDSDVDIFDRISLIELAKSAGCTVAETRQLVRGVSRATPTGPRWRKLALKKLTEVEERIAEAALPALTIVLAGIIPVIILSRAIRRSRPGHEGES